MANASPIPGPADQAQIVEKSIERHKFESDYTRDLADFEGLQHRTLSNYERRDLEQIVQPLADGVAQGATNLGIHAA